MTINKGDRRKKMTGGDRPFCVEDRQNYYQKIVSDLQFEDGLDSCFSINHD
jgi:hypothetical protein